MTLPPAGQEGHGRTAFVRRQPVRIVDGRFEGGYTDVFELICPGCGDNPYVDYSEVLPRLQLLRGPRTLRAALEAYDEHLGPCPGPNGDSAGSLGSPRAFRAWPLTRPAPPTGHTPISAARGTRSCSLLAPAARSSRATSTGPSTSGASATASAPSRSTTPVVPAARSRPRSTFTRASRWPSSGTAGSRSQWRSTPRSPDTVTRDALRRLSDWLDHDEDQGGEAPG